MSYNVQGSSGNLVLLSSQTAAAATSLSFTSVITTTYNDYVIRFTGCYGASSAIELRFNYSTNNGSSYLNGSNYSIGGYDCNNAGQSFSGPASTTYARLAYYLGTTSTDQLCGICELFNITSGSCKPVTISRMQSVNFFAQDTWGSVYTSAIAVNALQITTNTGTFSGTFKLYGVQN